MKTIQVPDDFDEYLLEKMVSKDWLSEWWHIDDVKGSVPNLTDQQARDVLESLGRYHDANLGINWEVIQSTADQLFVADGWGVNTWTHYDENDNEIPRTILEL